MKEGDYVRTPRFGNVKISEVFNDETEANNAGYYEPTHYEFKNNDGWNVLGKATKFDSRFGVAEMDFCVYKV